MKQSADRVRGFPGGPGRAGDVAGQNVAIEYRWAQGHDDRLPALAAELVRRQVAVIAAPGGLPAARAAKAATSTIPIVFEIRGDPVEAGLVQSLNEPDGNLTGVTYVEVGARRLELLRELVPGATRIGAVINPAGPMPRPNGGKFRRPPARSACGSRACRRPASSISTPCSSPWPVLGLAPW